MFLLEPEPLRNRCIQRNICGWQRTPEPILRAFLHPPLPDFVVNFHIARTTVLPNNRIPPQAGLILQGFHREQSWGKLKGQHVCLFHLSYQGRTIAKFAHNAQIWIAMFFKQFSEKNLALAFGCSVYQRVHSAPQTTFLFLQITNGGKPPFEE